LLRRFNNVWGPIVSNKNQASREIKALTKAALISVVYLALTGAGSNKACAQASPPPQQAVPSDESPSRTDAPASESPSRTGARRQRRSAKTGRDDLRRHGRDDHHSASSNQPPKPSPNPQTNSGSSRPRCSADPCDLRSRRFSNADR